MLLAIDTSTRQIGLALFDGNVLLQESVWSSPNRHTVELSAAIDRGLQRSGVGVDELTAVAVAKGPGSYTGLRIGMAVAKGLALSQSLPIIGVSTWDIYLASLEPNSLPYQLVIEAGRSRITTAKFEYKDKTWQEIGEAVVVRPEEFAAELTDKVAMCGELNEELRHIFGKRDVPARLLSPARCLRRPGYLAQIAWDRMKKEDYDDPAVLAPIYMKTSSNIPG